MISRRPVPALLLAVLGILLTATAHAGPPSAANSFVDPCLRVCPGGDMNFHVVVRDALNNPVAGSSVLINFGTCQAVIICPPLPTDPYTFVPPSSILMVTNAAGVADIPIRAGGVCLDSLLVFADGVLLAIRSSVASPDQNGDLTVNAVDNGILTGKLGSSDPTGDLNCSGLVDIGDPNLLLAHLGHSCQAVVPNRPRSWGSVKVIYR
jgi:hypothetical protein